MQYAQIIDGTVVLSVFDDPSTRETYADETWVECPDDPIILIGATYDGTDFTDPVQTEPVSYAPFYIKVVDGIVVEVVTGSPETQHLDFVDPQNPTIPEWCGVFEEIKVGATYDRATREFENPPMLPISPTAFKRRFTLTERTTIALARSKRTSTDPQELQLALALDIFFEDLDDPRLLEMDLTDQTVTDGLAFLTSVGIITAERAVEIGTP